MAGRTPGSSPPDPVLLSEYGSSDDEFAFEAGEYEVDEYEDDHRDGETLDDEFLDDEFLDDEGFDLDGAIKEALDDNSDEEQGQGDFNLAE